MEVKGIIVVVSIVAIEQMLMRTSDMFSVYKHT